MCLCKLKVCFRVNRLCIFYKVNLVVYIELEVNKRMH